MSNPDIPGETFSSLVTVNAEFSRAAILSHRFCPVSSEVIFQCKTPPGHEPWEIGEGHAQVLDERKVLTYWNNLKKQDGKWREDRLG
ncbi:hypothetical protein JMJ78_0000968, partial [Colletotrichum scovillei]